MHSRMNETKDENINGYEYHCHGTPEIKSYFSRRSSLSMFMLAQWLVEALAQSWKVVLRSSPTILWKLISCVNFRVC